MEPLFSLVQTLCAPPGPSGSEHAAAEVAAALLRPLCDDVTVDRLGNVIGRRSCGRPDAKMLLFAAHLDQIGFLVSGVTDEGMLRVAAIGGVDQRMLPSCEVRTLSDPPLYGVFTSTPPHLQTADAADKSASLSELFVDMGLSREAARRLTPPGTRLIFAEEPMLLSDRVLTGRAMDDRAGFAAIFDGFSRAVSSSELAFDVTIVGSCFEETGSAGARVAAYQTAPDLAVAVDVSHAKTPDADANKTYPFGGGALIGRGPSMQKALSDRMVRLAGEREIPFRIEVMEGHTGTDAWAMQLAGDGIPCGVLSIPLKYMHTPIETVHADDLQAVSDLIFALMTDREGGEAR